jgi:putative transposase
MNSPHCTSTITNEQTQKTTLGYRTFRCSACQRRFNERTGTVFTHETVRDWEARFAPLVADQLRIKRRGQAGRSWYVDEIYIKVHGKWCYLYRAIDADGNLVDSRLSEKRDMEAAQQFFKQALSVVVMSLKSLDGLVPRMETGVR